MVILGSLSTRELKDKFSITIYSKILEENKCKCIVDAKKRINNFKRSSFSNYSQVFPRHSYRLCIIFVFYTFIEIFLRVNYVSRSFRMIEWKSRFRDNMEFFPSLLEPWRDRDIVVRVIHAWRDYRENSECNVDNTRAQCTTLHDPTSGLDASE